MIFSDLTHMTALNMCSSFTFNDRSLKFSGMTLQYRSFKICITFKFSEFLVRSFLSAGGPYALLHVYQSYTKIFTLVVKKCLVQLLPTTFMPKRLAENNIKTDVTTQKGPDAQESSYTPSCETTFP